MVHVGLGHSKCSISNSLCVRSHQIALGSWADEMEDMPIHGMLHVCNLFAAANSAQKLVPSLERGVLSALLMTVTVVEAMVRDLSHIRTPTDNSLDYSDRYAPREQLPIPTKPPFTAHLGNLPFDAKESDIEDYFKDCSVISVRLVQDKIDQRPKGFGYVEFATADGLKAALDLNGTQFFNRSVKISVADPRRFFPG
jgi:RNA recognition motif. (a.k.a. RRM, RBD, or RNP domain)